MSDRLDDLHGWLARIDIDPEPTDEELVGILEVLRAMHDVSEPGTAVDAGTSWERIARQEALRSAEWPPQRLAWGQGRW